MEVENLARLVFDDDSRVHLALVLDDDQVLHFVRFFSFDADGFALFDILETDDTVGLGQNRNGVCIPPEQLLSGFDFGAFGHDDVRTVRHGVFFELAPLGVDDRNLSVSLQCDPAFGSGLLLSAFLALACLFDNFLDGIEVAVLQRTGNRGDNLVLDDRTRCHTTGVEGTHRQLRSGLADGLCGDNTDGKAFFDELTRREVGTVAFGTHAESAFACQGTADTDGLHAQFLDSQRNLARDDLVFANDHLIGDRVPDILASGPSENNVSKRNVNVLALVDCRLGHALECPTIDLGDNHTLCDIGQLTRKVTGVCRLESGIGQAFTRTVSR